MPARKCLPYLRHNQSFFVLSGPGRFFSLGASGAVRAFSERPCQAVNFHLASSEQSTNKSVKPQPDTYKRKRATLASRPSIIISIQHQWTFLLATWTRIKARSKAHSMILNSLSSLVSFLRASSARERAALARSRSI